MTERDALLLQLADELHSAVGKLLGGFKLTPGGDAYEYRGSMNTVEWVKEAWHAIEATQYE